MPSPTAAWAAMLATMRPAPTAGGCSVDDGSARPSLCHDEQSAGATLQLERPALRPALRADTFLLRGRLRLRLSAPRCSTLNMCRP